MIKSKFNRVKDSKINKSDEIHIKTMDSMKRSDEKSQSDQERTKFKSTSKVRNLVFEVWGKQKPSLMIGDFN